LSPSLDFTHPVIAEPFQDSIKVCVVKTVHDINRRDSNVVVVGLPEQLNTNDEDVFSSFCEDYLSVKPLSCGVDGWVAVPHLANPQIGDPSGY